MTVDVIRVRPPAATSSAGGPSLAERWAERDERYVSRGRAPLSDRQIIAVRLARIREAGLDPVAATLAARWTPPTRLR